MSGAPKNFPKKFIMKKAKKITIKPIMANLNFSRPCANLSLSPPDVIILKAAWAIVYRAKPIAAIKANSIKTLIILFAESIPPVGTPFGRPVSIFPKSGNDSANFIMMNYESRIKNYGF